MAGDPERPSALRRWLRRWPAVVLAAAAVWLISIWAAESHNRQDQVISSFAVLLGASLLLAIWLLLFSALRRRTRLLFGGGLLLLLAFLGLTVEITGVSGDLVPILGWRWSDGPLPPSGPAAAPVAGAVAAPAEFPQFLGPHRNATLPAVRLVEDWVAAPPKELWRVPVGEGWSGFAVSAGVAVTQGQHGENERVTGHDLATGRPIWLHEDRARFSDPIGGPGPRATPSIDGSRVYSLGGTGILNALRLTDGKLLWSRNVIEDNGAAIPVYGVATSPLIHGEKVVVLAGGPAGRSLVAYDKSSGEPLWAGGDDPAGYSSPLLARLGGVEQIVVLTGLAVVGHDPASGAVLWRQPWSGQTQMVAQPVVVGDDRIFVSTGYGIGARLYRIHERAGGWAVETVWESLAMKAKFTNVAHRNGVIYGMDDGILAAVDVESGRRIWKRGRHGHGQLLLVGDLLLVQAEGGDVVLVDASPETYRERARLPALDRKTWNNPALAGPLLLVRNDREAACFELAFAPGDG